MNEFSPKVKPLAKMLSNGLSAPFSKNQVEFGIDTDLNLAEKRLMIQQVSFQLNIMKQSPPPSKAAELMAAELNTEIERFKARTRSAGWRLRPYSRSASVRMACLDQRLGFYRPYFKP